MGRKKVVKRKPISFEKALEKWNKKTEKLIQAYRDAEKIRAEDLSLRVH